MLCERKVRYLDYYKNGERIRNGGFAKMDVRGEEFRMDLALKGLPAANRVNGTVFLCAGEEELEAGQIEVVNGCGEFRYERNLKNTDSGEEIMYGELTGIRIPLGETAEVICKWQHSEEKQHYKDLNRTENGKHFRREPGREAELSETEEKRGSGKPAVRESCSVREAEEKSGSGKPAEKEDSSFRRTDQGAGLESLAERENDSDREEAYFKEIPERDSRPMKLLEDKWLQLWAIYPHIQPFRDEREYLSVSPADFVLFSEESYRAMNNSFLLHGYYNYHHLILTRIERRGEILYYVGVPGNYFDREKQVAVMFGFESFECAQEPAQPGDFGYYMMKAKL